MNYDGDTEEARPRLRRDGGKALAHRQASIEEGLGRLDSELDRLGEAVAPILGPERPSPALAGGGSSDEPGSDLGRALEHYSSRLNQLTSRLSYLTDRLDL